MAYRAAFALLALAALHPLSATAAKAPPTPTFAEAKIPQGPDLPTGSTHEIAFAPNGDLWVTQQNQDRLVHRHPNGTFESFDMGQGNGPHGIGFDRAGTIWLTFEFSNKIVQVDTHGQVLAAYPIPTDTVALAGPHGLTIARDGLIWWTGKEGGVIGRFDPKAKKFGVFKLAQADSSPIYISEVSDGSLWFTELTASAIGRITNKGQLTEIALPAADSRPIAILEGPDHKVWFSMEHASAFGTIGLDRKNLKTYPVTPAGAEPAALAFDAKGHPWIQYMTPDMIARIEPDMSTIPYCIHPSCTPAPTAMMHRLRLGPDHLLWFTELGLDTVGKITSGY
jgi:virginiamycin B lyase